MAKKKKQKTNTPQANISQTSFDNEELFRIPLNFTYDKVYGFGYKPEEDENTSDK